MTNATRIALRSGWWKWRDAIETRTELDQGNVKAFKTVSGPLSGRLPDEWKKHLHGAKYVITSWQTPIAWYVPETGTWYIPAEGYSQTTTRHQGVIGTAITNLPAVLDGTEKVVTGC